MKSDIALKIEEEVRKQLDAGFIKVVDYPEWVANVVPVMKKDGRVRMCVDFRNWTRQAQKMTFPYLTLTSWWIILQIMPSYR